MEALPHRAEDVPRLLFWSSKTVSSCLFMAGWLHIQIQLPVDTLIHGDLLFWEGNCSWNSLSHFRDISQGERVSCEW